MNNAATNDIQSIARVGKNAFEVQYNDRIETAVFEHEGGEGWSPDEWSQVEGTELPREVAKTLKAQLETIRMLSRTWIDGNDAWSMVTTHCGPVGVNGGKAVIHPLNY